MEGGLWEGTGGIQRPAVGPSSVPRENILATWRFKAIGSDEIGCPRKGSEAWVAKASQRDMEILTRALQRELNSRPDVAKAIDASSITDLDDACGPDTTHKKFTLGGSDQSHNLSSDVASSASMSSCSEIDWLSRPASPAQGPGTLAGAEPSRVPAETISDSAKCTENCEQNSNVGSSRPVTGKISKKRPRGSNKAPVTILKADPANFREMVQRVTSVDVNNSIRNSNAIHQRASGGAGSIPVLRPQPKRPNRITYIPGLPTLDTSSCLDAVEPPGSYDYYLDRLVNNNNGDDDDQPGTMTRLGFDPARGFADYFRHYEPLKFPMNQHQATLPLDLSFDRPRINGDAGKFIPLRALNIGFGDQTEYDGGAFATPENSLIARNY